MDSNQDDWYSYRAPNGNITQKNSRYNNYSNYPSIHKSYYSTNVITSSKYNTNNKNDNSSQKTDVSSKYYKYINNNTKSDSISSQYYSQKNKYLITFNSNPRKFESSKNISSDSVIRSYANNCTFYISGSSDLKQKLNYQKKDYKIGSTYENKDIKKRTDNNFNRYINYSNNISRKDNNINKVMNIYTNSSEKNKGQNRYNNPISLIKRNEQKKIINYTQTEPSNNVIYYSQKTPFTPSINTTYISNYNKDNNYKKETNNITTQQRRIYKTSTNTNLNQNNRINYFKTEAEQKITSTRRNNTPTSSRLEDRYLPKKDEKKNDYNKINKNKERTRHTASEIPHNFNRQKYHYNIGNSSINNTNINPEQKYTLKKVNSNSNINSKYNRYNNYQTQPRTRQYGTRTETHNNINRNYSSSILDKKENNNNKIYELPRYFNKEKKTSPKKYETRSVNYSLPKYNRRNYGVNTETSAMNKTRNYLRNNEYEVNDINEYRKNEETKERNGRQKLNDHHSVYVSNNTSQNKKYKTSTQNNDNQRRNNYTLDNLNEYEVDINSNNKYDKYKRDKEKENKNEKKYTRVEINKNNYFKESENLEEEIELEEEQNEYTSPIFDSKNKKIENKIIISDTKINKFQNTPPSTTQNFIANYYKASQNNKYINKNDPLQLQNQNQDIQYIPPIKQEINSNKDNIKIEIQPEEDIEYNEEESNGGKAYKDLDNNNQKKPKYNSYFGDSNNNYYEIKGISEKNKDENEEEEEIEEELEEVENENITEKIKQKNNLNQIVRNVNFGIQSENICIPTELEEDKDEKEADEQQIEEIEQMDINNQEINNNTEDNNRIVDNKKMEIQPIIEENNENIPEEGNEEYEEGNEEGVINMEENMADDEKVGDEDNIELENENENEENFEGNEENDINKEKNMNNKEGEEIDEENGNNYEEMNEEEAINEEQYIGDEEEHIDGEEEHIGDEEEYIGDGEEYKEYVEGEGEGEGEEIDYNIDENNGIEEEEIIENENNNEEENGEV